MTDTAEAFKKWHSAPVLHDCWSAWQEATRQDEDLYRCCDALYADNRRPRDELRWLAGTLQS